MWAKPSDPPAVRPVILLHQEGILGLLAIGGLALRVEGPLAGLAPAGGFGASLLAGVGGGLGASLVLWLVRGLPALEELQSFQRQLVRDWTVTDALAVALLSGIAEEALLRGLLQPVIGLFPAAVLFAALHLVPDKRLWMWPLIALTMGVMLGLLFERFGYPAAAAAHIVINALALLRLRGAEPAADE
jgi:membrane protease YdiL (CAAX protease family)